MLCGELESNLTDVCNDDAVECFAQSSDLEGHTAVEYFVES